MNCKLLTYKEIRATNLCFSEIRETNHGAFGEPENTYNYFVEVGGIKQRIYNSDLILISEINSNTEVLMVISQYKQSDRLLELFNPEKFSEIIKNKEAELTKLNEEIKILKSKVK